MDWQKLGSGWPARRGPHGDDGRIGAAGAMGRLWANWQRRRRLARQLAELRGMSAYQLGDLGVSGGDLAAIAAGTFEAPVSRAKKNPADIAGGKEVSG
ncbi:DUF1127 domain-containing protein [Jeongeupia sp. USM3]|uniref:DUF1127 domain-containing protein n=1 Tax=Jeongeupia sp. USM3 TaxID=1906741 RepID=UPI00143920AD|nr:DUF1127 domain-containing protein [Jeongeupia sp. USM3]